MNPMRQKNGDHRMTGDRKQMRSEASQLVSAPLAAEASLTALWIAAVQSVRPSGTAPKPATSKTVPRGRLSLGARLKESGGRE